jgi:murein L,D-transpeptidase YcbB/YkuD
MESFKGNLIIFVFTVVILGLGYWAFASINSTNTSIIEDSIASSDVGPVVTSGTSAYIPEEKSGPETPVTSTPEPQTPVVTTPTSTDDDADLIAELEDLIADKVLMKKGSRGTRVGTVQKFLNEYGIKVGVDNDYGDTTVNAVKKFQTEQKLGADGQAGEGTYQKMIEWLQAN